MSAAKSMAAKVLKTADELTDAYASGWASGLVNVGDAEFARLRLTIVKDDATSIELRFKVEDQAGTQGFKSFKVAEGVASLDESQIVAADLEATDYVAIDLDLRGVRKLAVEAKKTGGSGTVTLAADILLHSEGAWA